MPTTMGGRRVSAASLSAESLTVETERAVSRKELATIARESEEALDLKPGLRLVLHELVGCWGEQDFDGRLMVWPSNAYLVARTGLSERAVRYALAALIELRLIASRESANGKRYARRDASGAITDAFGLDLAPLYQRRGEFVRLVHERRERARARKGAFDRITVCRRRIADIAEQLEDGELGRLMALLVSKTPRRSSLAEPPLEEWIALKDEAESRYRAANDGSFCRHKETNNESDEPSVQAVLDRMEVEEPAITPEAVLDACPIAKELGRTAHSWPDLIELGSQLRGAIGAHESAWKEAVEKLGVMRAAIAVLVVLQLHENDVSSGANRIRNPGGYFRAFVRLAGEGRLDVVKECRRPKRGGGQSERQGNL